MLEWPVPSTVRAIRGFLGLAGYYRRFIRDYGAIAAPLTKLLKKDGFRWSKEAEATFTALQRALTTAPVLQLPNFDKEFVVECDASGSGFGAVLHQGHDAVALFSRQIGPRHAQLAAYETELIGLVQAVRHWRPYLWGRPFVVKTDHFSLKYLLDQRLSTIPQHQWASKLLGFDFRVEYKPGATNTVADALSCRDTEMEVAVRALSLPSFSLFDDLRRELERDPAAVALREEIQKGNRASPWAIVDDLITYAGRIYIPPASTVLPAVLAAAHEAGHEGTQKTLHRLRADFHVP